MAHGGDIYEKNIEYDFSVSLNPLGIPSEMLDAVKASIERASYYPDIKQREVRNIIALSEGLKSENVYSGNGASELIMALARAFSPKRSIVFSPCFTGYEYALNSIGSEVVRYDLKEENGFKPELTEIKKLLAEADMIFVCDPMNPTGKNIEEDFLTELILAAHENNCKVCLDESFLFMSEKALSGNMMSRSELVKKYDDLIVIRSMTKLFAVPGIRTGYVMASSKNISGIKRQLPEWNISVTGEAVIKAGMRLIKETDFIKKTVDEIRNERAFLAEEIKKAGLTVFDSDTVFIFFKGPEKLYEKLLDKRILIRDCFDMTGKNVFFRIAVRGHEDNMIFINTLRGVLDEL